MLLTVLVLMLFVGFLYPLKSKAEFSNCFELGLEEGTCNLDSCGGQQGCFCDVAPNTHLCCRDIEYAIQDDCYEKSTGSLSGATTAAPPDATDVVPEEGDPLTFTPQVTLPGSKFIAGQEVVVSGDTLGEWVAAVYVFFVGAMAIIATVMMMWGGYQYVISFGSPEKVTRAKDQIVSAMIGLVLSLGAYMLLLTISPNLVRFRTLSIPPVETVLQGNAADVASESSEDYGEGEECLFEKYGNSESEVASNLVGVSFAGQNVRVHKLAADAFRNVSRDIGNLDLDPPYLIYRAETFNWREQRGSGKMSLHSFGIAIDINPENNPFCPAWADQLKKPEDVAKCKAVGLISDIPPAVIDIFIKYGFEWGGHWNSVKDPMHFEWRGGACLGGGARYEDIFDLECNCTTCNYSDGSGDCAKVRCEEDCDIAQCVWSGTSCDVN
ncbi:M15 family metallopeptidase [Patescibacteria group bacterium]